MVIQPAANIAIDADSVVEPVDTPLAFWALIFLTFIMFICPQALIPSLEPLHLAFVSATMAIVAYLASVLTKGRGLTVGGFEVKAVSWLVLFALLSIPNSLWRGGSYDVLFNQYIKSIIVFFLIANVLINEKRLRTLLWSLTLYSAFNAILGVYQYRTGDLGSRGRITGGFSGLTQNPNDLALSLNMIIPFMGYLYLTSRGKLQKIVAAGTLVSSVACIIVTWSRSGALSFLAMLLWFVWWRSGTRRIGALLGVTLVIVVALALAPQGYSERLASTTDLSADDGSAAARWATTKAGFRQTFEHPFGVGLGMTGLLNHDEGMGWSAGVHNVYLQISTELGIIPGVLFIVLLWKLIAGMHKIKAQSEYNDMRILAEATACTLVGFAFEAFFSPVAYNFYFYILAAIAVATREVASRDSHVPAGQFIRRQSTSS